MNDAPLVLLDATDRLRRRITATSEAHLLYFHCRITSGPPEAGAATAME